MKEILLTCLILISLISIALFSHTVYKRNQPPANQPVNNTTNIKPPAVVVPEPEPVTSLFTYDEEPAKPEASYFEKRPTIKSQVAYLAFPITIDKDAPPRLILYSHGSNTTVTKDFSDPFMKDMQAYGEFFTTQGFAFAASNMHGANWGSSAALEDMKNLIDWIENRYLIQTQVNLLGFSMGGLPTYNFAFLYPKEINSIFLLAPTSREYTKDQLATIKRIPIMVEHGNQDVNVPYSLSLNLYNRYKGFGFKNMSLETLKGKAHFDIDTERKESILRFFLTHEF
ncbi:alpha/beta fold hydrolase [bacterium]|nr:alpha/beta fold hydrolase [bacterium]